MACIANDTDCEWLPKVEVILANGRIVSGEAFWSDDISKDNTVLNVGDWFVRIDQIAAVRVTEGAPTS
jgi:hypothetical protein